MSCVIYIAIWKFLFLFSHPFILGDKVHSAMHMWKSGQFAEVSFSPTAWISRGVLGSISTIIYLFCRAGDRTQGPRGFPCVFMLGKHSEAEPCPTPFTIGNTSQIFMSSPHRGFANHVCIIPILVNVLPKQAQSIDKQMQRKRNWNVKYQLDEQFWF